MRFSRKSGSGLGIELELGLDVEGFGVWGLWSVVRAGKIRVVCLDEKDSKLIFILIIHNPNIYSLIRKIKAWPHLWQGSCFEL